MNYGQFPQKPLLFPTDYTGMTMAQKASINKSPELWKKAWFRVDISPLWGFSYEDFPMDGLRVISNGHPAGRVGMYVHNVRIENADDLLTYPMHYMVLNGQYAWLFDPYVKMDSYWEAQRQENSGQWFMEMLIYANGRSDEEIEADIKKASVLFDVSLYREGAYQRTRDISVSFADATREVCFTDDGYQAIAESFRRFYPDYTLRTWSEVEILGQIPSDVLADAMANPDQYAWVDLNMTHKKNMPWLVGAMTCKLADEDKGIWFFYRGANDNFVWGNDMMEDGENKIRNMALLLRLESDAEDEVIKRLRKLDISVEFSTEYAGEVNISGGENITFPGKRFSEKIDMTNIVETE